MISREEIMFIRKQSFERKIKMLDEEPIRPSWKYRVAMATTKKPYNFKKVKIRRKMAKNSRRINRRKK